MSPTKESRTRRGAAGGAAAVVLAVVLAVVSGAAVALVTVVVVDPASTRSCGGRSDAVVVGAAAMGLSDAARAGVPPLPMTDGGAIGRVHALANIATTASPGTARRPHRITAASRTDDDRGSIPWGTMTPVGSATTTIGSGRTTTWRRAAIVVAAGGLALAACATEVASTPERAGPTTIVLDPVTTTSAAPATTVPPTTEVPPTTAAPTTSTEAPTTTITTTPPTTVPTEAVAAFTVIAPNEAAGIDPNAEVEIGRSVEGRPITLIRRGVPGGTRVLVVGVIHGNEPAGLEVVDLLRTIAVPEGVELFLVPSMNPDGVVADDRQNANQVDLNRNFPQNWAPLGAVGDWQYGGPSAASEPETQSLVQLGEAISPDLVFWYHQDLFRIAPGSGRSGEIRTRFAELTGLPIVDITGGTYTGTASQWAATVIRDQGVGITVELGPTISEAEVDAHANAILAVALEFF